MHPLTQRRQQILDEMARLDRLQRGYLSQQYFTQQRGGQKVQQGPYFVLQHAFKGEKVSRRVSAAEAPAVRADLEAWHRFRRLAEEFAEVTEQMTLGAEVGGGCKKNKKRSGTSSLRRPKTS